MLDTKAKPHFLILVVANYLSRLLSSISRLLGLVSLQSRGLPMRIGKPELKGFKCYMLTFGDDFLHPCSTSPLDAV